MQGKNILICPLDWGLGHATRSIPIIRKLCNADANVIIGADRRPYALLKKEFPLLTMIRMPGYEVEYSHSSRMALKMIRQVPRIIKMINVEHRQLQKIIRQYGIDLVISDGRFGLWSKDVSCVYLTHQVMVKFPFSLKLLEPLFYLLHRRQAHHYTECWIPDYSGSRNLTGDLSHKYKPPANAYYIGPQTRFSEEISLQTNSQTTAVDSQQTEKIDLLVILSGPEPQRTIFENIVIEQVRMIPSLNTLILQGLTDRKETRQVTDNVRIVSHISTQEMNVAILNAGMILTRPGHTTIMDLAMLHRRAILVPTPGQTEQEYLAKKFLRNQEFYCENQSDFNLARALENVKKYDGMKVPEGSEVYLIERVRELLDI
ncbi:hypothetical protein HQ587_07010 [bacterium]|nr:hypothetical protein [bacterium]